MDVKRGQHRLQRPGVLRRQPPERGDPGGGVEVDEQGDGPLGDARGELVALEARHGRRRRGGGDERRAELRHRGDVRERRAGALLNVCVGREGRHGPGEGVNDAGVDDARDRHVGGGQVGKDGRPDGLHLLALAVAVHRRAHGVRAARRGHHRLRRRRRRELRESRARSLLHREVVVVAHRQQRVRRRAGGGERRAVRRQQREVFEEDARVLLRLRRLLVGAHRLNYVLHAAVGRRLLLRCGEVREVPQERQAAVSELGGGGVQRQGADHRRRPRGGAHRVPPGGPRVHHHVLERARGVQLDGEGPLLGAHGSDGGGGDAAAHGGRGPVLRLRGNGGRRDGSNRRSFVVRGGAEDSSGTRGWGEATAAGRAAAPSTGFSGRSRRTRGPPAATGATAARRGRPQRGPRRSWPRCCETSLRER